MLVYTYFYIGFAKNQKPFSFSAVKWKKIYVELPGIGNIASLSDGYKRKLRK